MTWNYRIMLGEDSFGGVTIPYAGIFEVYYDEDGNPNKRTLEPIVSAYDAEDLEKTLLLMLGAFKKPIFEDSEIPRTETELLMEKMLKEQI